MASRVLKGQTSYIKSEETIRKLMEQFDNAIKGYTKDSKAINFNSVETYTEETRANEKNGVKNG